MKSADAAWKQKKLDDMRSLSPFSRLADAKEPSISARALAERDKRRAAAHDSLTAALMGDPLPGYSALDRKRLRLCSG